MLLLRVLEAPRLCWEGGGGGGCLELDRRALEVDRSRSFRQTDLDRPRPPGVAEGRRVRLCDRSRSELPLLRSTEKLVRRPRSLPLLP